MQRTSLALLTLAVSATAQDIIIPLGFGSAGGPPATSHPVARAKDNNRDGLITADEIHAFATVLPTLATSGTNFMTDGRMVIEDGEPAFYFSDSEDGQVVRGVDRNHNGVIDPNEANVFFRFGTAPAGTGLFAPDTLGVYRDPATNQTRVYAALDNSAASSLGFTRGIHRLVDLNGDGDALDAGEQSLFASGSMGLTVPGRSGPVAITQDFWSMVRVLPGGKVVAFAQGANVNGTLVPNSNPPVYTYTVQPAMNAWYGFTDNNGVAVPEVWFNASALNDLPMHPAFDDPRVPSTSVYPNWDIQVLAQTARRRCFARFMDVVANGGPAGEHVYYLGASYNTLGVGDINLNGQSIAGLIYRVVDANNNQAIDAGELSLYCNISGQTYGGVPSVTFVNAQNQNVITNIVDRPWGFSAAGDGSVSFLYDNGGTHSAVVSMRDGNQNGVIDQGEVYMPYFTPTGPSGFLPPFSQALGPYLDDFLTIADFLMPGPFGAGLQPVGDGCVGPSRGLKPVLDAWSGIPQVGNAAFEVVSIRGVPNLPVFVLVDFTLAPTPLGLGGFGLPASCQSYLQNPITANFLIADPLGVTRQPTPIPNVPAFVGISFAFQFALFDPNTGTPQPFVTTNALQLTVQP